MKIVICALSLLALTVPDASAERTVTFHRGSTVRFATLDESRQILGHEDDWVRSFGPMDSKVRMQTNETVDRSAFLEFAASNAREWSSIEMAKVTDAVTHIATRIEQLEMKLRLPDEIMMIKTTGKEEGDAGGYTRGNAIIIPEGRLTAALPQVRALITHELFHVMTRHTPEVRKKLYELIHFEPCGEIDYPEQLIPRKLSNPDAFHFDACIKLQADGRTAWMIPLTLTNAEEYSGGGMFSYLSFEFLEVNFDGKEASVIYSDGQPVLHAAAEIEGYIEKIGQNTQYIIHPEEILADNFTLAVEPKDNIHNPEIVAGVVALLKK